MNGAAEQSIQVNGQRIPLPDGVSVAEWALERIRWQNPRIRAFLGCIRLLGGVFESNYAILHCSPERLLEIWRKVRRVAKVIRTEIAPLLAVRSVIPSLEAARQSVHASLEMLDASVLSQLDGFPETIPEARLLDVRKLLCVSIGQMHAFLQDAFGEIVASDPRSTHDSDYFLSRRFPQDIEEAEWLHASVERLQEHVASLESGRVVHLARLAETMRREETIPSGRGWDRGHQYYCRLIDGLTPKLKEILALRGIRFEEMEILDRYTIEVPGACRELVALHDAAREAAERIKEGTGASLVEREQSVRDLVACHAVFSARMASLLESLDRVLRDLTAFIPLWLEGIERRRALLLKRAGGEDAGDDVDDPLRDTRPTRRAG